MSTATLRAILSNVFNSRFVGTDLTIVWHAGEPLVVPIEFYREAVAITNELRPPTCRIQHSIQTNGTLISEKWCQFFLENEIRLGVSLDGPKHIHDLHRRSRSQRGTFDQVIAGIEQLNKAKKDFHIISVLTEANIFIPDEMFYFYDTLGAAGICFNVEESDGIHVSSLLRMNGVRKAFGEFLKAFMFLLETYKRKWFIREFEQMKKAIFRPDGSEFRNPQTEPFGIVSVDVNGNFTTFSPEFVGLRHSSFGDFVIGNLASGKLEDALSEPKFLRLQQEIATGVATCRETCEYFTVCGGGAPANKLGEHGRMDVASTAFCDCTVKETADLILSMLDNQIVAHEDTSART